MARRRKKNRSGLYMVVIVVMLFVGALSYQKFGLNASCKQMLQEQEKLQEKKAKLVKEGTKLKEQAAYVQTSKYIEDTAREKFGLVYKDEVIFKAEQ